MRPRTGPSLPQSLLEEIDSNQNNGRNGARNAAHRRGNLSRKEARKLERQSRKQKKAAYFTSGGTLNGKRVAETEHEESPRRKKQKTEARPISTKSAPKPQPSPSKPAPAPSSSTKGASERPSAKEPKKPKPKTALEKLTERSSTGPVLKSKGKSRQEQEEDAYIAYLESKLGWVKGGRRSKKYGKGLEEDGLDELLGDLDAMEQTLFNPAQNDEDEGTDEGGSEMDDEEYPSEDDTSDDGSGEGEESEEEETGDGEDDSEDQGEEEEEWTGLDGHHEDSEEAPQLLDHSETTTQAPSSRYVPPHLRNRASGEQPSEEMVKLTRQLKGLLNRLSEQNVASIIDGVEEVYRNNRRHDVTSTLTKLIIDGISSHSILLDSYVVLHAAFISAMHKLIGVEFAAYFVQQAVASYEQHLSELESSSAPNASVTENTEQVDSEVKGKETSNLIVLMSELYNFQVVSCALIYDLIKGLLEGELTEFKVELLLKVTRNSGQQLRTDDPSALKDIVHIVHSKLPEDHKALSSRTRFMIETLSNLKNNRVKKAASQHAGNDAVERMKKFLSGLSKKRHVLAHEPLRVSLDDLHSAETKGKWWLVGAAWGGDPLVDRQQQLQNQAHSSVPDSDVSAEPASESALLKLARKQGMNTDIRRSIFVVLMSSEDYVHACERLSQLKLTEVQQREIIRVILHCCGNEKAYNPYYTLIVQQLCRLSVSHKFTLQYCLWDFLRDLGETTVGGVEILKNMRDDAVSFDLKNISETRMSNLAKAYGWWIAKDCVTLAILKPVDFTVLKPQSRKFLVQLFTDTFISTQLSTPLISSDPEGLPRTRNRAPLEEVFIKVTKIQALALGLMYFLGEVVKHEAEDMDESGFLVWATKVALDTLRTGLDVIPNL